MKKRLPFFLLLLLLILLFQTTIYVESQDTSPALLKYVLQWPPTFCINLNSEEHRWCKEPIPEDKFTLHGLMPADEEGFNIICDYHEDPDWDEVFGPIEDELVTFWPSLRVDFDSREFWKRQWRSHGSCGGTTPGEYFHKAIQINWLPERGNLFNYFEASGIIPSDEVSYSKEDIVEAIQNLFYDTKSLLRRRPPPRPRSPPPPPRRSPPPPPRRSPPPPPRRSPPPPPRRSPPPPPRRSPPPPPRRSPPPPPRRSPPPPPRFSPPPPPRRSPPPPPRFSPPPPPTRSPPPPPPSPPPPYIPPSPPSPPLNVYLSCIPIYPEDNTYYYLSEVTLCTNLDGNEYISCPSEAEPTSCPDHARIMLPHPKDQPVDLPLNIRKKPMEHISDV